MTKQMTKQEAFIQKIAKDAQKLHKESGIYASLTIAQACLETGYGKSEPTDHKTGKKSRNLFGVKGVGNNGFVECKTWEVYNGSKVVIIARFRAYETYFDSLADHMKVLQLARYKRVREAKNPIAAVHQLHPCGYATDPDYGDKLESIIKKYDLTKYDKGVGVVDKELVERLIVKMQSEWYFFKQQDMVDEAMECHELAEKLRKVQTI